MRRGRRREWKTEEGRKGRCSRTRRGTEGLGLICHCPFRLMWDEEGWIKRGREGGRKGR